MGRSVLVRCGASRLAWMVRVVVPVVGVKLLNRLTSRICVV